MAVFNNIEDTEINGKFVITFSVSNSRSFKGRKTFETMPLSGIIFEEYIDILKMASVCSESYDMLPFTSAMLFEVAPDGTKTESNFAVFQFVRVI